MSRISAVPCLSGPSRPEMGGQSIFKSRAPEQAVAMPLLKASGMLMEPGPPHCLWGACASCSVNKLRGM